MGAPSLASPCGIRHSEVPFRRALPKYPSEVAAWHTGGAASRGRAGGRPLPSRQLTLVTNDIRRDSHLPAWSVKDGCLHSKAPGSHPPSPGLVSRGWMCSQLGSPFTTPHPPPGLVSQGVGGVHSRVPRSQHPPPPSLVSRTWMCAGAATGMPSTSAAFTAGAPATSQTGQLPRSQPVHSR